MVVVLGVTGTPPLALKVRLFTLVAPRPSESTRPFSTAVVIVIVPTGSVNTRGALTGQASVVNESVAPVPVSGTLFVAVALNVYVVAQVRPVRFAVKVLGT